ncbi:MAG: hypothetical protein AAF542_00100 [Pseudomonadota bacterium]
MKKLAVLLAVLLVVSCSGPDFPLFVELNLWDIMSWDDGTWE